MRVRNEATFRAFKRLPKFHVILSDDTIILAESLSQANACYHEELRASRSHPRNTKLKESNQQGQLKWQQRLKRINVTTVQ